MCHSSKLHACVAHSPDTSPREYSCSWDTDASAQCRSSLTWWRMQAGKHIHSALRAKQSSAAINCFTSVVRHESRTIY